MNVNQDRMIESYYCRRNVFDGLSGVVRRVNVNQFNLSAKLVFEGVQSKQVVPLDEQVFPNYAIDHRA